ncbi:MAG: HAD-IIIA family hydrolase [Desulfovibrio sp.]|jgi:D-glycero-D-manno-heptose 1,7-bisphosphate phosphatase|nr:HAD-IIIA family hydrolase [Desulfovibrio sp.]
MPINAILLDRDGTVIKDKHYLSDPRGVSLLPGVGETLSCLTGEGMRFFLVSNQSGVGRGLFSAETVDAVNARLAETLLEYGVRFTDMLFCPHKPDDACRCRKPAIGMWNTLKERYKLSPKECLMVGDKEEDMLFAGTAGLALRVLILTGKGSNTARKLGLRLPAENCFEFRPDPVSPAHPHLLIPSLRFLRKGLDMARMAGYA